MARRLVRVECPFCGTLHEVLSPERGRRDVRCGSCKRLFYILSDDGGVRLAPSYEVVRRVLRTGERVEVLDRLLRYACRVYGNDGTMPLDKGCVSAAKRYLTGADWLVGGAIRVIASILPHYVKTRFPGAIVAYRDGVPVVDKYVLMAKLLRDRALEHMAAALKMVREVAETIKESDEYDLMVFRDVLVEKLHAIIGRLIAAQKNLWDASSPS